MLRFTGISSYAQLYFIYLPFIKCVYMGQVKLKFTFFLPQHPKSWNYRYSKHDYSVSTEGREEGEREGGEMC